MFTLDERLAVFGIMVIVFPARMPLGELLLAKLLKLLLEWVDVLLDCKF